MTCRGLANSGLQQAGIGQATVSHLPASPNHERWLTGAWRIPAYDKPESGSRGVSYSLTRRLSDSPSSLLNIQKPTRRVMESFFDYEYLSEFEAKNWNGSKGSVRDLWGTNFCKNPRKSASLPCPFKPLKMVFCSSREIFFLTFRASSIFYSGSNESCLAPSSNSGAIPLKGRSQIPGFTYIASIILKVQKPEEVLNIHT